MIYARLLVMTRSIQLAAVQAALPQRTVIRLDDADWRELTEDPNFRFSHDGNRDWTVMNDILITHHQKPVATDVATPRRTTRTPSNVVSDGVNDLEAILKTLEPLS